MLIYNGYDEHGFAQAVDQETNKEWVKMRMIAVPVIGALDFVDTYEVEKTATNACSVYAAKHPKRCMKLKGIMEPGWYILKDHAMHFARFCQKDSEIIKILRSNSYFRGVAKVQNFNRGVAMTQTFRLQNEVNTLRAQLEAQAAAQATV